MESFRFVEEEEEQGPQGGELQVAMVFVAGAGVGDEQQVASRKGRSLQLVM
jgi:hypothetical protein